MKKPENYEYAFSVTSQFYYCGLPLRLDTYSRCQFDCTYCFAKARGGNRPARALRIANPQSIARKFELLFQKRKRPSSVIDEFLLQRIPIHFGGMADPFPPMERSYGKSLEILRILAQHTYPTIISTKSDLLSEQRYLDVLKRGRFLVQISLSTALDALSKKIDTGTAGPSALLRMTSQLAAENIAVTCRLQPLIPSREKDASDLIQLCSSNGVRHIGVEYLKLPIEKSWPGKGRLSLAIGFDIDKFYRDKGATRIGREWILPLSYRLPKLLSLRSKIKNFGMTFGCADNDLLPMSDSDCCCSGADIHMPGVNYFRYNYNTAVRRGMTSDGNITLDGIRNEWYPKKTVARFVNSRSRLNSRGSRCRTLKDYVLDNWNGSTHGFSPKTFHGVSETGKVDRHGFKKYRLTTLATKKGLD